MDDTSTVPRKRYPVKCVGCGVEFSLAKSIGMEMGMVDGHCGCTHCKQFHHVKYDPQSDSVTLQDFDAYLVSLSVPE